MKNLHINMPREEFEETAIKNLNKVVATAKKIRGSLEELEKEVAEKEEKIRNYQETFSETQTQLVKLQAEVYAKGTA